MEHIKNLSLGWLVGAAARKAVGGAMMAAALLVTACSSDDTMGGETKTEQTATVIRVTVGAGITDPTPDPIPEQSSPTRSLSPTGEGSSADDGADGQATDGAAAPRPCMGGESRLVHPRRPQAQCPAHQARTVY